MKLKIIQLFLVFSFCVGFIQLSFAQQVTVINQKGTKIAVVNNIVTTSAAEPTIKNIGDIWFDTTTNLSKVFNGTIWNEIGGVNTTFSVVGSNLQIADSKGVLSVPLANLAHTGTKGSVFFAGTDGKPTESNSQLFWDATNNRLGVGTNSPSNKLHVSGAIRSEGILNSEGNAGEPSYRFNSDTNTGMFRPAADQIGFSVGGNEAVNISEPTIGNTKVTIKQTLKLDGKLLDELNSAGTTGQLLSATTTGTKWINSPTLNNWSLTGNSGTTPGTNFLGTTDNNDLVFKVNNVESGRIGISSLSTSLGYNSSANYQSVAIGNKATNNSSLNVAIGNESKSNYQSVAIGNKATNNGTESVAIGNEVVSEYQSVAIGFGAQGNANQTAAYGYKAIVNSLAQYSTAIGTNASVNADNQYSNAFGYNAKVNASGYVINATAIGTNASVSADNSTAVGYNALANQSNTVILGDNSASIGIRTSAPTQSLDVNGNIRVRGMTSTTANNEIVTVNATGVLEKKQLLAAETDNKLTLGANGGVYLGPTVYTDSFIISASGNISISGIPFQPSQVTFVAYANVESFNIDSDNGTSNNDSSIANSFGGMNGFARNSSGTIVQRVIYVGGSGNSINDISRFSSDVHCIGLRYGDQNGTSFGKTTAKMVSFDINGFTLNVDNKIDNVVVIYTAYK